MDQLKVFMVAPVVRGDDENQPKSAISEGLRASKIAKSLCLRKKGAARGCGSDS